MTLPRGLYLPKPGLTVRVDGQAILDLNAVANTVTLFPQEPEILHLLPLFDYVYIMYTMKGGKITDEGSFSDLLRQSPVYQEMWAHQKAVMEQEKT